MPDVQRVAELAPARPPAAFDVEPRSQLVALEQHDLRSCLGEVERGADAHDAAADDHHVRTLHGRA